MNRVRGHVLLREKRCVSPFFFRARSALPRPPLGTPLRDMDFSHDPLSPEMGGLLQQRAKNRDMYLRYVSRFARKLPWKERGHALKGLYRDL